MFINLSPGACFDWRAPIPIRFTTAIVVVACLWVFSAVAQAQEETSPRAAAPLADGARDSATVPEASSEGTQAVDGAGVVPNSSSENAAPVEGAVVIPETGAEGAETVDGDGIDAAQIDAEIAALELSDEAKDRLDAARGSVVQIRGFRNNFESSAFHGTGFAVDNGRRGATVEGGRRIVTNYHVISPAVLFPREYRLEYLASDGRKGKLNVLAIDVLHDLAIVAAADLDLPPLKLRSEIPDKGTKAWSIGFPLNLGLTITEGVANGLVGSGVSQRIHYTGAINSGMSGGPALDRRGRVYGVNVSVVAGRQLVGFVVPAEHIPAVLERSGEPLDERYSELQLRRLVTSQVRPYEAEALTAPSERTSTQTVGGYVLPTQLSRHVECSSFTERGPHQNIRVETVSCRIPPRITVQSGLQIPGLSLRHSVLQSTGLHRLQFERQVNKFAAGSHHTGGASIVAPFACRKGLVSLDGFDARVSTCVRQYRLFVDLYDFNVTVVGIDDISHTLVSRLVLQGVAFDSGARFLQRFLGELQWKP